MPSASNSLRDSLLALQARDLSQRQALEESGELRHGYHPLMEEVHRDNANRLRELINLFGWPNETLAGADGAEAAWLIAQHAISEPAFMRACRSMLEAQVAVGAVPMWQLAYLDDRIRVLQGSLQRFGTQFEVTPNGPELCPVEESERLDSRRREAGLSPIADRIRSMQSAPRPTANEYARHKEAESIWRAKVGWTPTGDA